MKATIFHALVAMFMFVIISCTNNNVIPTLSKSNAYSTADYYADNEKVVVSQDDADKISVYRENLMKAAGNEMEYQKNEYPRNEIVMKYFARALAKTLKHPKIRALMKDEIAKRFDDDDDALWKTIAPMTVDNQSIEQMVMSRFADNQFTAADFNSIALLHIYLYGAKDWKAETTPKVASNPICTDDVTWTTIPAWDCNLKEFPLDAKNPPAEPVFVIGLNERTDAKTGKVNEAFLAKRTSLAYKLSWFWVNDPQEPWSKGDAEMEFGFLTDNGHVPSSKPIATGIKGATWKLINVQIAPQGYLGSRYSVVIYEDDGEGSQISSTISCGSYSTTHHFYSNWWDSDDFITLKNNVYFNDYYYCSTSPAPTSYQDLGNLTHVTSCYSN
jgi:hypothetical protein